MRRHDNFLLRVLTEKPCGCKIGYELRLTMSWSNINDDALFLARSDVFKNLYEFKVVWSNLVARIDVIDEVKKALPAQILRYSGVVVLQ